VKSVVWVSLSLAACLRERTPAPPPKPVPPAPYRVTAIVGAARIEGVIALADSAAMTDVIVWIDGVRSGKPIPLARRYELDHQNSGLVPRVQAALRGGMLNVRNADDSTHRARFMLAGEEGAADSLLDTVEESGAGQVVPAPAPLARAGLVKVTCDLHPATRGWIRVFDQPYFTMPDSVGRFAFDSVPPGAWTLRAWSPLLGETEREIVVDSAGSAYFEIRLPPS